jgi:methyl-accepting chemotaxis protein
MATAMKAHSLFYGDAAALARMKGEHWQGVTPEEGAEYVTKFWLEYEPIDEEAAITQMKIGIANTIVQSQIILRAIAGFEDCYNLISQLSKTKITNANMNDFEAKISVCKNDFSTYNNNFLQAINEINKDLDLLRDQSNVIKRVYSIKSENITILNNEIDQLKDIIHNIDEQLPKLDNQIQEMMDYLLQLKAHIKSGIRAAVMRTELETIIDTISSILDRVNGRLTPVQQLIMTETRLLSDISSKLREVIVK